MSKAKALRFRRSLMLYSVGLVIVMSASIELMRLLELIFNIEHSMSTIGFCVFSAPTITAFLGIGMIERTGRRRGYRQGNAVIGFCARNFSRTVAESIREDLRDDVTTWHTGIKFIDVALFNWRALRATINAVFSAYSPKGPKL
ncbi:hypothetical protein [Rhizobium sp. PP-CC-3G-465]|uniref:hypothetical protein n=1 Tax=Rhizobium sp. PP-CC-3G-465 TaxID=2135648 RepID=UPI001042A9E1|nr:hypothetical protein C8J33_11946 [Rhizobium sp. PP-CC-3G-465]